MRKIEYRKHTSSNKRTGFIGAYLPDKLYSYLAMYSLTFRISKSKIVEDLLQGFWDEQSIRHPFPSLIQSICTRLQGEWYAIKFKEGYNEQAIDIQHARFEEWKNSMRKFLKRKGIETHYIYEILNKINL